MRVKNLPLWVTILAGVLAVFSILYGVAALFDTSLIEGLPQDAVAVGQQWAGRNIGLGLVAAVAIWLRSPAAYAATFAGAAMREISDVIAALTIGDTALLAVASFILILDLIALFLSLRAARSA